MPKGILVVLNVFVESKELEKVTEALEKIPQVLDLYEVTGEYDLVAVINAENINAFRTLLKDRILKVQGIRSTVSSIILHIHKKEGRHVGE